MSPRAEGTLVDEALLRARPLPSPEQDHDKDSRGRVLVVGGGVECPGAALLSATGALRVGAGKAQIAATTAYGPGLAIAMPEARVIMVAADAQGDIGEAASPRLAELAQRADAVVIGPGMMDEACAGRLAADLIAQGCAAGMVIDAAAMTGLREHEGAVAACRSTPILTPHAGEMAALLGAEREAIEADPARHARQAAARFGAVVAMKGQVTFIASPDGALWRHEGGCIGLGTAGSGDVLAGLIGGLRARGADAAAATLWGVFLHGQAGEALSRKVGRVGFLAREILHEIAPLLERFSPA